MGLQSRCRIWCDPFQGNSKSLNFPLRNASFYDFLNTLLAHKSETTFGPKAILKILLTLCEIMCPVKPSSSTFPNCKRAFVLAVVGAGSKGVCPSRPRSFCLQSAGWSCVVAEISIKRDVITRKGANSYSSKQTLTFFSMGDRRVSRTFSRAFFFGFFIA